MNLRSSLIALTLGLALSTAITPILHASEQSQPSKPDAAVETLRKSAEILRSSELRRDPEVRAAMEDLRAALRAADEASVIYNDPAPSGLSSRGPGRSILDSDPFFNDPWDPISGLSQIRALQNRMLQGMNAAPSFQAPLSGSSGPSVSMKETADRYVITASLPGVEQGKLDVDISSDSVTLSGTQRRTTETRDPSGNVSRSESMSTFRNVVALPGPVDSAKAETKREGEQVTITIPKAAGSSQSNAGRLQATIIEK
jgi:HSP20 family molecular chaperone IbpA